MGRCRYGRSVTSPDPIYTAENCRFSHPLNWGVSVFWREPCSDDAWFPDLAAAVEPDGLKLKSHRFTENGVSQFVVATTPEVAPVKIVQRIKGRLQHLVRADRPKALKRNFALHGFGKVTRDVVEKFVAGQLGHHRMAEAEVQRRLEKYQISCFDVDLSQPQKTSHGLFWYSLHLVLVHQDRWNEIRESVLAKVNRRIRAVSEKKGYLLREAGILPDHIHILVGCPFELSPLEVSLRFLNNLAHVQGMKPIYQFGGFVGTVGEYSFRALSEGDSAQPG